MLDRTTAAPEATALLRRVPMLAALPEPVVERLAREAVDASFRAGTPIVREGEPGDRFYVVKSGTVEILGRTFGSGSGFGEIALLRDVPRTATVRAASDASLWSLERDSFLRALLGNVRAQTAATAVADARLGAA